MGAKDLFVGLALTALFTFAIINYVFGFAADNSAAVNLADDGNFSILQTSVESNLDTAAGEVESISGSMATETLVGDVLRKPALFQNPFKALYNALSIVSGTVNQTIFGGNKTFGVITTSFLFIIGIIIAMYAYKALRGNPD